MKLLIEAGVIGIGNIIIFTIIANIIQSKLWHKLDRNLHFLILFLSGVSLHLFCEVSGINRWYCEHGNACQTN